MNSEVVRLAMTTAFKKLSSLNQADFQRLVRKHEDGPIARALLDSGMFEGRIAEARARERIFNVSLGFDVAIVIQTDNVSAGSCIKPFRSSGTVTIAFRKSLSKTSGWNRFFISESVQKTQQLAWAA